MMPERIWADGYGTFGVKPGYIGEREYIRADIYEAAVREEREACAQIAQRIADQYADRTKGKHGAEYHYNDGASDAADEIVYAISEREPSTGSDK